MELLTKVLALSLTLSQVFTRAPGEDQVKRHFAVATEAEQTASSAEAKLILRAGCEYAVRKLAGGDIDVESLLTSLSNVSNSAVKKPVQMSSSDEDDSTNDDPSAAPQTDVRVSEKTLAAKQELTEMFGGKTTDETHLDAPTMLRIYRQFCQTSATQSADAQIDLIPVLKFYNDALSDLPDYHRLLNLQLPQATTILDPDGKRFSELYLDNGRRKVINTLDLPPYVRQAFVSAEDKNFFGDKIGLDLEGLIRAYKEGKKSGRYQGGSTITQQMIKNILVGDDQNYPRKIKEAVLASLATKYLRRDQILDLYINAVYFGYSNYGIEMASLAYYQKPARRLTIGEAATLAGVVNSPRKFDLYRHLDQATERRHYVLGRMRDDKAQPDAVYRMSDAEYAREDAMPPNTPKPFIAPIKRAAFYLVDNIQREALDVAHVRSLYQEALSINATVDPYLQTSAEQALQDELANYEEHAKMNKNRPVWDGPLGNIANSLVRHGDTWQEYLPSVRTRYFDVHWPLAVVLDQGTATTVRAKNGKVNTVSKHLRVGLADGRTMTLNGPANVLALLKLCDLIFVRIDEDKKIATLRIPPHIQGAVVVLEAKTGRVLAHVGGFSYGASQFDRAAVTYDRQGQPVGGRQVGSTIKPFVDMASLRAGYQPDTLVPDVSTWGAGIPALERGGGIFNPKNNDGRTGGLVSMRVAIEQSLNIPTVQLACRAFGGCPQGLDQIQKVTHDFVYPRPQRFFAHILGAQESHLITMASAYATFANVANVYVPDCPMCLKPTPHYIDSIERDGRRAWQRPADHLQAVNTVDRVALFQMRRILEGSPARGTSGKLREYAGYIGCKTGTTNHNLDAWLICFTNDVVVATWVGYDRNRFLGPSDTGASVALPIGRRVLEALFERNPPRPLSPAPPDIQAQIVERSIPSFGRIAYRLDQNGRAINTRDALLNGDEHNWGVAGEDEMIDDGAPVADDEPDRADPAADGPERGCADQRCYRPPNDDRDSRDRPSADPQYYRQF